MQTALAPHSSDVRQYLFHNTCYILSSLKAMAAQYPAYLTDMMAATPVGVQVRHFGLARVVRDNSPASTRFVLPAVSPSGHSLVATQAEASQKTWPTILRDAFLATTGASVGSVGYPDQVLFWALGCRAHTSRLPRGPARKDAIADLARLFIAGECIVLLTQSHCWALVGASVSPCGADLEWSISLSDPRGLRNEFVCESSNLEALTQAVAFSVTFGAARAARGVKFSLDTRPVNA